MDLSWRCADGTLFALAHFRQSSSLSSTLCRALYAEQFHRGCETFGRRHLGACFAPRSFASLARCAILAASSRCCGQERYHGRARPGPGSSGLITSDPVLYYIDYYTVDVIDPIETSQRNSYYAGHSYL